MSISFKKKVSLSSTTTTTTSSTSNAPARLPSGTRLNTNGTLLLTSTGISSLDSFIGGGLPIGSLLLIYEDPQANLSDSIVRCFLAEGIYNKQDLCLVKSRDDLMENLPVKEDQRSTEKTEHDSMKIAWRYENLSQLDLTHEQIHYDLQSSKAFPSELRDQVQIHRLTWKNYRDSQSNLSFRSYLLSTIRQLIANSYSSQHAEKRILRLAIPNLSSALFDSDDSKHDEELVTFLYHLRVLLRTSLVTCIVTMNETSKMFENLADLVVELKIPNAIAGDYVGFCQLRKLPRLNTFQAFSPETWDIGIKLLHHRRNLIFENYSIPPDLSDQASREDKSKTMSCSSTSKELDF